MQGTLTFTRPTDVIPDDERPGLLRARVGDADNTGDARQCQLSDLRDGSTVEPGLEDAGFETIDLSNNAALQRALDDVRTMDCLTESVGVAIRGSLTDTRVDLHNGTSLRIELVVDDGLFHRRSGPNGLDVNPGGIDGANGFGGARYVHGDQDVFGTPLRQLMGGAAPDTFRHVSPDGRNDDATTFLLNLWVPLHAPVQPLALLDRRTLDARRHQLRYGLPIDEFLERDDEQGINDIWNFLYDPDQQWYIRTNMTSDHGYLFDTLGTGHGAAILPGEDALEEVFLLLHRAYAAIEEGDLDTARAIVARNHELAPASGATPEIAQAWTRMADLLDQGRHSADLGAWAVEAQAAMTAIIRTSVEMRLVATVIPG